LGLDLLVKKAFAYTRSREITGDSAHYEDAR
jgi:hypothetical protein